MWAVSSATMREIDRRTIAAGTPGTVLMDRAGRCTAYAAARIAAYLGQRYSKPTPILLIAGRGNNGGDVFAAAHYLLEWGYQTDVRLAGTAAQLKGDAHHYYTRFCANGGKVREYPRPEDWTSSLHPPPAIIIDGLLGTGASGAPQGVIAAAIEFINRHRGQSRIVAVDTPSGLDTDNGTATGAIVRADFTVTMGRPKAGLLKPEALEYVGTLSVADIGLLPPEENELRRDTTALITPADLPRLQKRRARNTHKGNYGHLLIIAGARGYAGAAILAARAALASGAGLVSVLTPAGIASIVAGAVPEAMVHPAPENAAGALRALPKGWAEKLKNFSAIAVGPGLTAHPVLEKPLAAILETFDGPVLLDADALNVFAGQPKKLQALQKKRSASLIITPHPGEMGRLLGLTSAAVQSDRRAAAERAVKATDSIVVLKGAGTLIATPQGDCWISLSGNPGMAKGGSGDVLAGLMGGLLSQLRGQSETTPQEAVSGAVFLHGHAGDIAAWRKTEQAMTASDIIAALSDAWRDFSAGAI